MLKNQTIPKGSFTNYVDKRRGVGSPKMFVNVYKVVNVNGGGVGCQKKPKTCQRSL